MLNEQQCRLIFEQQFLDLHKYLKKNREVQIKVLTDKVGGQGPPHTLSQGWFSVYFFLHLHKFIILIVHFIRLIKILILTGFISLFD